MELIVGCPQPQPTEEPPTRPREPQSLYYGPHLLWGTAPYYYGPGGQQHLQPSEIPLPGRSRVLLPLEESGWLGWVW